MLTVLAIAVGLVARTAKVSGGTFNVCRAMLASAPNWHRARVIRLGHCAMRPEQPATIDRVCTTGFSSYDVALTPRGPLHRDRTMHPLLHEVDPAAPHHPCARCARFRRRRCGILSRVRVQPLVTVADVAASSRWYQQVLGLRGGHGGDEYEQLFAPSGELVLQLHSWDAHDHALLGDESLDVRGNGSVLWFETDDFAACVARAKAANADIADGPLDNPLARHQEVWLRDPDGYVVVVASAFGTI